MPVPKFYRDNKNNRWVISQDQGKPSFIFKDDGTIELASGNRVVRTFTYVIAASDAPAVVKAQADYVCDGTADDVEIQAAIDALPAWDGMRQGGGIKLSLGNFYIADRIDFGTQTVWLCGEGLRATCLRVINGVNKDIIIASGTNSGSTIEGIKVYGNSAGQASGNLINTSNFYQLTIRDCDFEDGKDGNIYANGTSEWVMFHNVGSRNSPYPFNFSNVQWYDFYDCTATNGTNTPWMLNGCVDFSLINCVADEATIAADVADGFMMYNSSRISLLKCRAFGEPAGASKLIRGIRVYRDSAGISFNITISKCEVHNLKAADGCGAYELTAAASGAGLRNITVENCTVTGTVPYGAKLGMAAGATFTDSVLRENDFTESDISPVSFVDTGIGVKCFNNVPYIQQGEIRTASGSLTAGVANAIAFAWHNPEAQDIYIKKVVINISTGSVTANSVIDVGIADDAAGTNRGVEFFDDLDANDVDVNDSLVAGDGGTQTKWVLCQDSASATDGWVVGQILVADAAALVGTWYIEYTGK